MVGTGECMQGALVVLEGVIVFLVKWQKIRG